MRIVKKIKSRRSKAHARTLTTFNNKLNKLKSTYQRLYNNSKKAKDKYTVMPEGERKIKDRKFFCDNYPTQDSFLKNYKLKVAGKEGTNRLGI